MRLRNIPAAQKAVSESQYVIQDPMRASDPMPYRRPVHIEIGMGKGQFLFAMADENPSVSYIGIERHTSVLYRAVQKAEDPSLRTPSNISFICADASQIESMFPPGSVDVIYLNFSDPWPKKKHADRRLTSRRFLQRYQTILSQNGRIEMKTDHAGLFAFTLDELRDTGWEIIASTTDLHHDPHLCLNNHMTEYEEKFSAEGHLICKVIARPPVHEQSLT